ncbi:hypothetical protein BsWGS_11815 [Bradybaena similaris]
MSIPHYEVVVKEEAPFVTTARNSAGNITFSGLAIDLLSLVAGKALFKYNIRLTDHVSYVYQDHQGKWQGLVSELFDNADLAVGPIPIIKQSSLENVEFTKPFMTSGISLLIKYPPPTTRGINLMLEPFAAEVWVMICLAFIVISLALFLIGRFSPYEWARVSKEKDPRAAHTSFGLKNSFLFAASTLSWQGYRDAPRSMSGRILMCMWFMFTVFVIVGYTACLCAILTTRRETTPQKVPFAGVEDIVESKQIKLGAMKYSHVYSTLRSGKSSHNALFSKLYTYIDDSQEWIQKRNEGVQRVKDSGGKYALLMETVKAEYITATNCDLITYGESLSSLGYGLAIPKNSPVMDQINLAIIDLHESGVVDKLISKYFLQRQSCPQYDKSKLVPQKPGSNTYRTASSLDMRDMAIPFLFLFLGVLGAGGALAAEIYYKKRMAVKKDPDNKARQPLNTDTSISKAPMTSPPPPPPIYKVINKLQDTDKHKKGVIQVVTKPDVLEEKDIDKSINSVEMVSIDDKVEADREDSMELEMAKGEKASSEPINEIV